jgi:hypothetical protein
MAFMLIKLGTEGPRWILSGLEDSCPAEGVTVCAHVDEL